MKALGKWPKTHILLVGQFSSQCDGKKLGLTSSKCLCWSEQTHSIQFKCLTIETVMTCSHYVQKFGTVCQSSLNSISYTQFTQIPNPITIIIFPYSDTNKIDLRPILGHNPPVDNQLTSMHPSTAKHPFAYLHIRPTNAQWRSMAVRFPRGLFLSDLCITSSGW